MAFACQQRRRRVVLCPKPLKRSAVHHLRQQTDKPDRTGLMIGLHHMRGTDYLGGFVVTAGKPFEQLANDANRATTTIPS